MRERTSRGGNASLKVNRVVELSLSFFLYEKHTRIGVLPMGSAGQDREETIGRVEAYDSEIRENSLRL